MLLNLDLTKTIPKPDLYLCKMDKTVISHLSEVHGISINPKLTSLSELNFNIPYKIENNNLLIDNSNAIKLKDNLLIKYIYNSKTTYFVIDKVSNKSEDSKSVQAFESQYTMKRKKIRKYSATSYNLLEVLNGKHLGNNGILKDTNWSVNYIDPKFIEMYRQIDFSSTNVYESLNSLQNTFDCVFEYTTEINQINVYRTDDESQYPNRGLIFNYGHYLSTLSHELRSEKLITRLFCTMANDESFQKVNPLSTDYIEDFSYFMYPYTEDASGNILTHSAYMNDGLCHSILLYNKFVDSKRGEFNLLISKEESYQKIINAQEIQLSVLKSELVEVSTKLTLANIDGSSVSDLLDLKRNKETQINNIKIQLIDVGFKLSDTINTIDILKTKLSKEANFTLAQLQELSYYTFEDEFSDDKIIDPKDLYNAGVTYLNKYKQPETYITLSIVDFLACIESQHDWDKLKIGEWVTIKYPQFGINHIEVQITELNINHQTNDISVTIANIKETQSPEYKLAELLYNVDSVSKSVSKNQNTWNQANNTIIELKNMVQSPTLDAKIQNIIAGDTTKITGEGVTTSDKTDSNKQVKVTAGTIGASEVGSDSHEVVIDSKGVKAAKVYGDISEEDTNVVALIKKYAPKFEVKATTVKSNGSTSVFLEYYTNKNTTPVTITSTESTVTSKTISLNQPSKIIIQFSCKVLTSDPLNLSAKTYTYGNEWEYNPIQYCSSANSHVLTYTDVLEHIPAGDTTIEVRLSTDINTGTIEINQATMIVQVFSDDFPAILDVTAFTITNTMDTEIDFTWVNPTYPYFKGVELYRSTSDITNVDRAYCDANTTLAYSGTNQSYNNTGLTPGTTYYYKIFTKAHINVSDYFSRGVSLSNATLLPPEILTATTNTTGDIITLTFNKDMADPTGKQDEFGVTS